MNRFIDFFYLRLYDGRTLAGLPSCGTTVEVGRKLALEAGQRHDLAGRAKHVNLLGLVVVGPVLVVLAQGIPARHTLYISHG